MDSDKILEDCTTQNAQNNLQPIQPISVKSPYWASVVRAWAYRIYLETNYWVTQKQGQNVTLKTSMYLETLSSNVWKVRKFQKKISMSSILPKKNNEKISVISALLGLKFSRGADIFFNPREGGGWQ